MRKLSKLIAVIAAMALLMGMSTSAFAANATGVSPSPGGDGAENWMVDGQQVVVNGETLDIYGNDYKTPTPDEIKQIMSQNGYDMSKISSSDVVVLDAENVCAYDVDGKESPVNGAITLWLSVPTTASPGDIVYVMHKMHNGQWEVLKCKVGADNRIQVTLQGLSPVYLVKFLQELNRTDAANTGKSPKTGF